MDFATLSRWAEEEVKGLTRALPPEVRKAAANCPVIYEAQPGAGAFDDELEGDELGLFEGASLLEDPDAADPPRIRLFLQNLWDYTEGDEQDYRDEVGTTLLHELGHYLGWDEDEVADRGLE